MNPTPTRIRRRTIGATAVLGAVAAAALAFPVLVLAFHYAPDIPITTVGGPTANGTLAQAMPIDVLSVDSFTRAINQAHGTQTVLTRNHFAAGQSTGWHTHPGPNIVLVVSGGFRLLDDKCHETVYAAGEGFATGLRVHEAIAVDDTDFYSLYFLPADATELREPLSATDPALAPRCAE
ncbi:MAG TPA: hypothetical protein VIV06_05810 [Candidatus Limnocylindrales bacterium]